jgi:hypothetical protein
VKTFKRLAVAISSCGTAVGHFIPQVIPLIFVLYDHVPKDATIVVALNGEKTTYGIYDRPSGLVRSYLGPLFDSGVLNISRFSFVSTGNNPTSSVLMFAEEVFFYVSQEWETIVYGSQTFDRVRTAYQSLLKQPPRHGFQKNSIVVIKRSGARAFNNHSAVTEHLRAYFAPHGLKVVDWVKSGADGLVKDIDVFDSALLGIGVHGAGLGNMIFFAKATPVIEICFKSTDVMGCPAMFFQHATMLALPYWFILANGSYMGSVDPDLMQLTATVQRALATSYPHRFQNWSPVPPVLDQTV